MAQNATGRSKWVDPYLAYQRAVSHPEVVLAVLKELHSISHPAPEAKDAEIARLREAHEKEVENILDDAQEWEAYVTEDSAPCSLRHRLVAEINQRAAITP